VIREKIGAPDADLRPPYVREPLAI
jgi:hypothetical protein